MGDLAMAPSVGPWDLYENAAKVRSNIGEVEARDLVIMNANPIVWVKNHDTDVEVHWADVSGEPWPEEHGYGPAPEEWPYGN